MLDSEPLGVDPALLDQHLVNCPSCRAWREQAHEVTRRARLTAARPVPPPDAALASIRNLSSAVPRWQSLTSVRLGLILVALAQAAVSLPILILGSDRDAPLHVAHEMGSFDLALAAGFLVAAWRPVRAHGMQALVGVAVLLLIVTAAIDLFAGRTTVTDELPHLISLAGWALLLRITRILPDRDGTSMWPELRAKALQPRRPSGAIGPASEGDSSRPAASAFGTPRSRRAAPLACVALLLAGTLLVGSTQVARADGDPGSDVLVYQNLFVGADAGTTIDQQVKLGNLLQMARQRGTPIRVAIIAHADDLGAVTALWRKPQAYARFLGIELSLAYKQRLLVVMPDGFGFSWPGHSTTSTDRLLSGIPIRSGAAGLVSATTRAVTRIAAATGVTLSAGHASVGGGTSVPSFSPTLSSSVHNPAPAATRHGNSGSHSGDRSVGLVTIAILLLLAAAFACRRLLGGLVRRSSDRRYRLAWGLVGASLILGAALATPLALSGRNTPVSSSLASNPVLDPGTSLSGHAPDFTLINQFGRPVSLRSFRGKVVLLAFTDSECTTICPLTTSAMLDAQAMLGSAGSRVQLLGVDANPKDTSLDDVLSYTQLHGLIGRWQFLTGSLPSLRRVWHRFGIQAEVQAGLISHTPALYVIGPRGQEARLYMTQQSYAAVGQLGQLLAQEASQLLPGHPRVNSHLSYTYISGTSPTTRTALPVTGGRRLMLGPGHSRLLLFFATWDQEVTSLAGHLVALDGYQRAAAAQGLPELAAVDEEPVEPSPEALPRFLGSLPGRLSFPVGVDTGGQVADGYGVSALPFLEVTSSDGRVLWYWNVSVLGWPSTAALVAHVRAALAYGARTAATGSVLSKELAGSPPALAALHAQASRLLGSTPALMARLRALHGYPVVVNAWASWCGPCREEFGLFAQASAANGRKVAFLGADTEDSAGDARTFLAVHHVSYPSYQTSGAQLQQLIPQGLEGLPTTIFINPRGRVLYVHTGQYDSLGTLNADIASYALKGG